MQRLTQSSIELEESTGEKSLLDVLRDCSESTLDGAMDRTAPGRLADGVMDRTAPGRLADKAMLRDAEMFRPAKLRETVGLNSRICATEPDHSAKLPFWYVPPCYERSLGLVTFQVTIHTVGLNSRICATEPATTVKASIAWA